MLNNPYQIGLDKNPANYASLSPLSFIRRAAEVYPSRTAVIYNDHRFSWSETFQRCKQLTTALKAAGINEGDTVATMLPNVPALYEAHFGVAAAGAVLNAINIRLDAETVSFILDHSRSKLLLVDPEFVDVVDEALKKLKGPKPLIIDVLDDTLESTRKLGTLDYETWLAKYSSDCDWDLPEDEWNAIALGYTSGTTGNPKGVVTHHRGAYLNSLSNILSWNMSQHPVYLWTLPMFHCNGWCFPWTLAALAGTNVCLRRIDVERIYSLIREHRITHYCGAPIVHSMMADAPSDYRGGIEHQVHGLIAGAAPPASVFERMAQIGFQITHVYGLTETYGPAVVCAPQEHIHAADIATQVAFNGRQGVRYPLQEDVQVLDPETMQAVPKDGLTVGEVMFKGNAVMKGYLLNPSATTDAFVGGWFHSGDLAVVDPDGYLKIKDRSKDIIISGGENIASLEVEEALQKHSAVGSAAVVAMADSKWGEVPAAFVELRPGCMVTEAELLSHCRTILAHFKVPKRIIFGALARTSTGKVQKFALRAQLKAENKNPVF